MAAQLVVLIAYSAFLYSRFDLAEDFAMEAQAWHQIGLGNFNPYNTIYGFPFVRNNVELLMWPIGIVGRISNNAFSLLALQDLCLAVAAWVAWSWWCDIAERRSAGSVAGVLAASGVVLVVIVLSPITYIAAAFDVHSEALAAPLVILVGYELWRGQAKRALMCGVLLLLVHNLGASYLAAMAVPAIIFGRGVTRRIGGVLLAVAAGWFLLLTGVGAVQGGLWDNYAYLTGKTTTVTGGDVLFGAVTHLHAAFDMARSHTDSVARIVTSTGSLGLLSLWGLLPTLVVLGPPALSSSPVYISTPISFQVVPLVAPMAVASGWVALELYNWLTVAGGRRGKGMRFIGSATACAVMAAAVFGVAWNAQRQYVTWKSWSSVDDAAASTLSRVQTRIPSDAEVIVVSGVSGRFYAARSLFILSTISTRFPVCSTSIVLILTNQGMEGGFTPPTIVSAANAVALTRLHAHPLIHRSGVIAYTWHTQPGARQIELDPADPTGHLRCG